MRELTMNEMSMVAGAEGSCGNNIGGVTKPSSLGSDLIQIYEGLVAVTSHVIERIAKSF